MTSTEETTLPEGFVISAVYPNPFRGTAALSLEVPRPVEARVQVYDLLGREVATLADGYLTPGSHTFRWDGAQAPASLYFIRVETDTFTATRKVTLLR